MDGLSLYAVTHSLGRLVGGKIEKIQQPERDTILLTVRAEGSSHKLLLSAHPQNARVQLTEAAFANPPEAPSFCMLLRRRAGNARILGVEQPQLDRVLHILLEARDELGDLVQLRLVAELMGKHSNIIFLNAQGTVLDCTRHVNAAMSSVRVLLPGVAYIPPPQQEKQNPLEAGEEAFLAVLQGKGAVHKLLSKAFFGLSPDCARQMVARWSGEDEIAAESLNPAEQASLAKYLCGMYGAFARGEFSPTLVYTAQREPVAVYPFQPGLPQESLRSMPSMGAALDAYYAQRDVTERMRQRGASLQRTLQNHLERCYKKLSVFEAALQAEEDLEQQRLYGELLIANAHLLKKGVQSAKLMNYYLDPPREMLVPLDEKLSPQENAQRFFKRYQKGKAAKALAVEQRKETLEEIEYLEGQLDNLSKSTTNTELSEIREELVREGYVRPDAGRKKAPKLQPSEPLQLRSSEGYAIYIGKNNQQNDRLTLRFARGEDWWLHTKNIPGSHVIVRAEGELPVGELPERTLKEAAMLAAYYSKARASASVPVDYAQRKYVKKPGGAKPGMVIYTNNKTIYVTPDPAAVKALEQAEL